MSSSAALQQHLSKLDTPGPVQHYAIAAIFDTACQGTGSSPSAPLPAPAEGAILQCLCLQDGQAAGVAAEKLVESTRSKKIEINAAHSLLLTALAVASPSSATPLIAAVVSLWHFQLGSSDSITAQNATLSTSWKSHILSKALLASPYAGTELISSICKILVNVASVAGKGNAEKYSSNFIEILSSLRPFLSFVFLDPIISKQYCQHALNLHSSLVRTIAAPGFAAPENQHAMLSLLCSFLPALQAQSTERQLVAESCVADIMDLVEACETEPEISIIQNLVDALLSLCNDISSYGGSIAPFLTALATLFSYWPPAAILNISRAAGAAASGDICLQLTRLSVSPSASSGDSTAALSLLCSILLYDENKKLIETVDGAASQHRPCRQQQEEQQQMLSAAVSVQLAPVMAFGQLKNVKEWASRALAAVNKKNLTNSNDISEGAMSLLCMLWSNPTAARCWLHSLESELSLIESPSTSTTASIFPPTINLLLSLLHHPEVAVTKAALDALVAAVRAAPLLGITALPVLIHKLHTTVEKIGVLGDTNDTGSAAAGSNLNQGNGGNNKNNKSSCSEKEALASLLPTLYALPQLAVHPSAVAFTVRALQPLLAPPSPDFLQGVALRMLCYMWLTTGRGFPHLRTALLSYSSTAGGRITSISPHILAEDPALRRAWAASLAEVCAHDGDRAKDLIHSITECLETSAQKGKKSSSSSSSSSTTIVAPEVQAAGLECVAELCEADILDFYKAWKIVKPLVPTLPQHPVAAAAWLRLLASGGLDAAVYPEISRGIFNILWTTAQRHSVAFVRAHACASLAAYDFLVLEENGTLTQEMWEFGALLRGNVDTTTLNNDNTNNCEELVVYVLQYEHTTRRRQQQQRGAGIGKSSKADGGGGARGRFPWSNRTRAAVTGAGSSAQGVLHKLVSVFPKALLGGGSRDSKDFLTRIPDITPCAVLLLWSPPPPPAPSQQASATANKAAAAVAAKHAVAGYAAVFSEVCKQSEAGFAGGCSSYSSSEILAAWASFIKRWVSAAKDAAAAGTGATASASERTTAGAQAVWQVIKTALSNGSSDTSNNSMNVTVGSSAACAAAALASSVHPQPLKAIVEQVFAALTQHAQQDLNGIYVQASACTALGHCTDVARSVLGLPALSAAIGVLQRHLANTDAPPAVRAGSALGLSLAAKQLATKMNKSIQNVETLLRSIILSLLCVAASQFSEESKEEIVSTIKENFAAGGSVSNADTELSSVSSSYSILFSNTNLPEEVFDAVLVGLAESLPALLAVGLAPSLLCMLRTATTNLLSPSTITSRTTPSTTSSTTSSPAAVHGLCQLLKGSTLVGFKMNIVNSEQVLDTLELLKEMVLTGNVGPVINKNTGNNYSGGSIGSTMQKNGKIAGAAALALGSIIPSLTKEGFIFPSTTSTIPNTHSANINSSYYLEILVDLAREGGISKTMTARAAAKQGAAGGIAALLQGKVQSQYGVEDTVGLVFSEVEKQALDALDVLSIKDEDIRVCRGCGRALAELCWSARHNGKSLLDEISAEKFSFINTTSSSTINAVATKGVASLPENSALRYLCETIDSGSWPEIFADDEGTMVNEKIQGSKEENQVVELSTPLTPEEAAAVLRCVAAAPRLPVMDWSAACRRLLRTHQGSSAVQKGIVLLFSAHASVSQALQMYHIISEDIFGQPGFTTWQPEAQHAVLKELLRLLAAMPDGEAISVLRMLCEEVCPDASIDTSTSAREIVEWQAALLQGLSTTAAAMKKQEATPFQNENDSLVSVAETAWECAMHAVLPKLPVPTTWPLNLKLSSLYHYIQKDDEKYNNSSSSSGTKKIKIKLPGAGVGENLNLHKKNTTTSMGITNMKPWTFLLECALTASSKTLIEKFSFSPKTSMGFSDTIFSNNLIHWTWICAALLANNTLGDIDLRILQQSRNYIINNSHADGDGNNETTIDILVLLVARAVGASSSSSGGGGVTRAQKQQWIMDVIHAAEKCTSPAAAVKLAAIATVAFASDGSGGGGGGGDRICFSKGHSVLVDCDTALSELPGSLKYLAESVEPCPVALVTSVVVALSKLQVGEEERKKGIEVKELQKQCCWALRHALPADTWVELYTRVEREML